MPRGPRSECRPDEYATQSNMKLNPEELAKITDFTLSHYNEHAEDFWEGTRGHNVNQNITALLQGIEGEPPYTILDFGCGPGRDLKVFAELGHTAVGLDRKALGEVATAALPDTILGWYRRLVARKFDGSHVRQAPGRPPISKELQELIVRMAKENRSWGYDRIVGALANLGYQVSDQAVGNILRRHGIPPAPERCDCLREAQI
jgi:hypothetical protein